MFVPTACGLDTFGQAEVTNASSSGLVSDSTGEAPPGQTDAPATSTSQDDPTSTTSGGTTSVVFTTSEGPDASTTSTGPGQTEASSTGEPAAICGDMVIAGDETCDDGNLDDADECTNACLENPCGNGVLDDGEQCDDGERKGGDTCTPTCELLEIDDVAVGTRNTCALFVGGAVRCWGQNEHGELCNHTTEDLGDQPDELPVVDIVLSNPVKQIVVGNAHTCARFTNQNVVCWGYASVGLPSNGTTSPLCDMLDEAPQPIGLGGSASDIAAGGAHTCAIMADKSVKCWGVATYGQLGHNKFTASAVPVGVVGISGAIKLSAGAQHTCALLADETVRCWGHNLYYGTLGIGNKMNIGDSANDMTAPVTGLDSVVEISSGGYHNCARRDDGDVYCWGHNGHGQLGTGEAGLSKNIGDEPTDMLTPVDLGGPAAGLALGYLHSCALLVDGGVKCWGYGGAGSLGYANTESISFSGQFTVLQTVDLGGPASKLRSFSGYDDMNQGQSTCAILEDLSMRCWGNNDYGQLGLGHRFTIGDDETPNSAVLAGKVPY